VAPFSGPPCIENVYISLSHCKELAKFFDIAATVRPISIKFGTVMQNASVKCTAVKIFNFKNPSWWTNAIFKIKNDAELVSQAILNFET